MKTTITYHITTSDSEKTIYTYLREHYFKSKTFTLLRHSENDAVFVNGHPVLLKSVLHDGDTLEIVFDEDFSSENIVPVNLPFEIVYEDEHIMVVNKPKDMPVHPAINNFDNTLANGIAYYFENKGEEFVFRCINRLDRDTSGLLIVAKNRISAAILSDFMKNREIKREYRALVAGHFDSMSGTIDAPIARVNDSLIERCVDFENGASAITHYTVLKEYDNNTSLLSIHLDTGRTHQIRVHMAYIGHPLMGDHLYNNEPGNLEHQALHSYSLKFRHPITLEEMEFISEPD